ncbi:MAG: circularly permuted type 2 ATP-grasp protein [Proteobacteria bacterium]|nr:circularly permuted type 2 ATP-grasp protein [Pseudomonadota bacterium]
MPLFDETGPLQSPPREAVAQDLLRRARPAPAGHHDELRDAPGRLRPAWQAFAEQLGAPLDDLQRRHALMARQIREDGVTYNVYGGDKAQAGQGGAGNRPWSLEVLPLLIEAADWHALEQGVAQRARLLNAILADTYGEQRLLKEALLPSALVLGHPGYLRGLQGVMPPGGIHLHVLAFDLARGPEGGWWVVSHRTQAPSGLGYVMQNRLIVSRQFPDAYRALNVQHLASGYRRLLDTLTELAAGCAQGQAPRLALLTPGPYNETYFEQAYLARYLGLPLVEGGDLVVRDERLFMKTVQGLEPLHGVLRRLDDDFCDPLELRPDSHLGVPGLMQAARAGNVVLANALGTGFLESPAVHGFLPALSQELLGEPLALPSLPTWWCGEASAWEAVRDSLGQRVIRPSHPGAAQPGFGEPPLRQRFDAVLGQSLNPAALQAWRARIDHDPAAYTVQDFVPHALAPVWQDGPAGAGQAGWRGHIGLRGATLRVYALSDGRGGWQVLPGGMTRIAAREPEGQSSPLTMPMTMQAGGSSLDTWVLTDGPVDTFSMLPATVGLDELVQRQRPVASRTGENLFWMGRYTERAEQQLRLVQNLIGLASSEDEADDAVLQALSALSQQCGLVPADTPSLSQAPRVFERAALDALCDPQASQGACSLAYNLDALARSAQTLRERLSPAHARLLRTLGPDFLQAMAPDAPQSLPSLQQAHEALEQLAMQLSAVTGAQTDRMTRDAGWRLLTVGRLIERLVGHAGFLQAFCQHQALQHPQGFDQVLDLFDSAITFRARFQRRLERPALLSLLVMDENNPRALACVLRRLRTELGKLPEQGGSRDDLLALLPHQGVGLSLAELCQPCAPGTGDGQDLLRVQALCARLIDAGWRLSDEVARLYFVHAEPHDAMVSA